jgi:hypothetical protein
MEDSVSVVNRSVGVGLVGKDHGVHFMGFGYYWGSVHTFLGTPESAMTIYDQMIFYFSTLVLFHADHGGVSCFYLNWGKGVLGDTKGSDTIPGGNTPIYGLFPNAHG